MNRLIILIGIFLIAGCNQKTKNYKTKVIFNYIENREVKKLEDNTDDDILYLFFTSGFQNDDVNINYYKTIINRKSITTEKSTSLATLIVISKNVDGDLTISISNGPKLKFNPFDCESNYWDIGLRKDTLFAQPYRHIPTFE